MERNQFTFYRSYRDALRELPPKEFKAALLAICDYALDESEPDLSGIPNSVFILIRPTLDSGRIKAANRAKRTESGAEQTENKRKTKAEQKKNKRETKSEQTRKEKEGEREEEKERENDSYSPLFPLSKLDAFSPALRSTVENWLRYKSERREPYKPQGLKSLVTEVKNNASRFGEAAVISVINQSMSSNYQGILFDRLPKRADNGGNVFLDMLQERGGADDG